MQIKCMNQKYWMMISGLVSVCILISGCTNSGYHDNRYDDEYAGDVTESGENRYSEETEMSSAIEEEDNLSSYTKAQIATEEFCLFEGTWEMTEYLDTAVEYHAGIDYEDEEYIRQVEEYIKKYKDKYLGKQLIIRKDTIEMFGPITELGYYVESSGWLFDSVRQPSTLGIEPPFVCADILLKDSDEYFYMIYDDNGRMLLDVAGEFFELEKQEQINNE